MSVLTSILPLFSFPTMDSTNTQIAFDFSPRFRVLKDGRVERFVGTETVPPSTDPVTGVQSKDVVISPETAVSARLFLPKILDPKQSPSHILHPRRSVLPSIPLLSCLPQPPQLLRLKIKRRFRLRQLSSSAGAPRPHRP